MKIAAICGSPHKGNTYSVLKSIKENYPDIEFKILTLSELEIQMCKGCYGCVLKGENVCPLKDDRDLIVKEMMDADGVIIASPTYAAQVPGILKNFIDRISYFGHRPVFFDKFAMSIVTGAGYGIDDTSKYMNKIFSGFGFNMVPAVVLQTLPKKIMSEKKKTKNQNTVFKAFEKFTTAVNKGKRDVPSMGLVVVFSIFKSVSAAFKEVYKADYAYYKNKADYYYDTRIPFYKKWVAKNVVKKTMRG